MEILESVAPQMTKNKVFIIFSAYRDFFLHLFSEDKFGMCVILESY